MVEVRFAKVALVLVLAVLVGCHTEPKVEEQMGSLQVRLNTAESSQSGKTLSGDNCGLDDSSISKPTKEILAAASRDETRPPNEMMIARVAINGIIADLRPSTSLFRFCDYSGLNHTIDRLSLPTGPATGKKWF